MIYESLSYESIFIAFVIVFPCVFIIAIALHFLWRVFTHGRIRDDDDFL